VILLALTSKWTSQFLLSSEYYESWRYMPILYLSVAFNSLSAYYGAFYLGAKKTTIVFVSTVIAGIISILMGLTLVKEWGLMGVAFSTLIGYLVLFIIRVWDIKRFLKVKFPIVVFVKYLLFVLVALFVVYVDN